MKDTSKWNTPMINSIAKYRSNNKKLPVIIFLQHLEQLHVSHLSDKHKIIKYFRYVDDVLFIYDTNHTDVQNTVRDFNTIHPKLKFTVECKTNNQINFLDITIHRTPTNWRIESKLHRYTPND